MTDDADATVSGGRTSERHRTRDAVGSTSQLAQGGSDEHSRHPAPVSLRPVEWMHAVDSAVD